MKVDGWKYYNHAAIPTDPPHKAVDVTPVENGEIWKMKGNPLLARWTDSFDCGEQTQWWYVIKDTPFDISQLKAKRRYEINKGIRNFEVRQIDSLAHGEAIFTVTREAYQQYPAHYRPNLEKERFLHNLPKWRQLRCYGAFDRETGALCGYALLREEDGYVDFSVLKALPESERKGINAALVNEILLDHAAFLEKGGYLCDGSRSVLHETAFQDYLEKYFLFRKAYCKLHIRYKKGVGLLVDLLYPFRKLLEKFRGNKKISALCSVLRMEQYTEERGAKK